MIKLKTMSVVGLLIGILSTIIIILYTSTEHTLPNLLAINPTYMLGAVILHLISYGIWGYRTTILCRSLNEHVSVIKSTEIMTASLLMAAITPSNAGGEPLRVVMLTREGISIGKASAIIIAERIFDAILLLLALPFSLIVFNGISVELNNLLFIVISIPIFAIILVPITKLNRKWRILNVTKIVQKLFRFIGFEHVSNKIISKIKIEIINFKDSFVMSARNGRTHLVAAFAATIAFWFVEFMSIPIFLYGLNVPNAFSLIPVAFAAQVIVQIVMAIPITPGASGVAEVSSTALLSTFIPLHLVGIVVICWRAVMFYMNIIVGAIVSIKIVKMRNFSKKPYRREGL